MSPCLEKVTAEQRQRLISEAVSEHRSLCPSNPQDGTVYTINYPGSRQMAMDYFGGVSFAGIHAAQYWVEFILWEALLNERPYRSIVELGTWEGGFSLYLNAQAEARNMGFRTYDIHQPAATSPVSARSTSSRSKRRSGSTCS